jgi:hypothetical protein
MNQEKILSFVKLVVSAIQTNHPSTVESKKALTEVLEEADTIHKELTGKRIVTRGHKTVLDALVSHSMTRI